MKKLGFIILAAIFTILLCIVPSEAALTFPNINIGMQQANTPQDFTNGLQILIWLTILTLAPSIIIMAPTCNKINDNALQPYMKNQITQQAALDRGIAPIRDFMFKQTHEKELALFVRMAKIEKPKTKEDLPTYILLPSFILSELKTAFTIGFVVYLPFLVIDIVVSSVLVSMGMMFLPPTMIALPFKLIMFVMVDGWYLVVKSLVESFVT